MLFHYAVKLFIAVIALLAISSFKGELKLKLLHFESGQLKSTLISQDSAT